MGLSGRASSKASSRRARRRPVAGNRLCRVFAAGGSSLISARCGGRRPCATVLPDRSARDGAEATRRGARFSWHVARKTGLPIRREFAALAALLVLHPTFPAAARDVVGSGVVVGSARVARDHDAGEERAASATPRQPLTVPDASRISAHSSRAAGAPPSKRFSPT